jgi:HSP20 family molecular chaperone IbpA
MAEETKALEVQKEEVMPAEDTERTRETQVFVPHTDIYETDDEIIVLADVPGANQDSIDVMLEKNVLTINAFIEPPEMEGYSLVFGEYGVGDYERRFTLSDEIDREKIEATVSDGVLRLTLPKAGMAKTRKIAVKAE